MTAGGAATCGRVAADVRANGFDVRAIRAPTVEEGEERIRVVLHSHNDVKDVERLVGVMKDALIRHSK